MSTYDEKLPTPDEVRQLSGDAAKFVTMTNNYYAEAREGKRLRMLDNRRNFDVYHMRQDYSHKQSGQSREFVLKQGMAVEQIASFFQQGLVDTDDWFTVDTPPGVENPLVQSEEIFLLLKRQLEKAGVLSFVGDSVKLGLLGSLMIAKVHGQYVKKPKFFTVPKRTGMFRYSTELRREDRDVWELRLSCIRQEDYYPDPNGQMYGKPLYEIQDMWMDLSELAKLCEGNHALYDRRVIERLAGHIAEEEDQKLKRARETGQNITMSNYRSRCKVSECWGTMIEAGSGKILAENSMWTIVNNRFMIQEPKQNPFWHGESPFVVSPIIRVPFSTWHKALMDAPTLNNIAMNELYNLLVDGGMMAAHGIKQVRTDWLANPAEVENGISPGATLQVNTQCPPGAKVLETVSTTTVGPDALQMYNLMNSEFNQSALTNDLRMGVLPNRQVKATEVVEASQTITSIFTGLTKVVETNFMGDILRKSWLTCLQNMNDMDSEEAKDLLGPQRALELNKVSNEDRFVKGALGYKFIARGVSGVLSRMKDFKKLTAFMQTIAGAPPLLEEFMKKYSVGKFLEQILRALDINTRTLEISPQEQAAIAAGQAMAAQAGGMPGSGGPDMQSQIPQVASMPNESVESRIPRTDFPRTSGGVRA